MDFLTCGLITFANCTNESAMWIIIWIAGKEFEVLDGSHKLLKAVQGSHTLVVPAQLVEVRTTIAWNSFTCQHFNFNDSGHNFGMFSYYDLGG